MNCLSLPANETQTPEGQLPQLLVVLEESTHFPDLQSLSHTRSMSGQNPRSHRPCVGWQLIPHLYNWLETHIASNFCFSNHTKVHTRIKKLPCHRLCEWDVHPISIVFGKPASLTILLDNVLVSDPSLSTLVSAFWIQKQFWHSELELGFL